MMDERTDLVKETEEIFDEMEKCITNMLKEQVDIDDLLTMDNDDYAMLRDCFKLYKKSKEMALESLRRQAKFEEHLLEQIDRSVEQNREILYLLDSMNKKSKKEDKN